MSQDVQTSSNDAERIDPSAQPTAPPSHKVLSLLAGPLIGFLLFLALPESLSFQGQAVAGCAAWMAIWWITEAAPIPVTSLLPLVLFPLFGMDTMTNVAAPYANPVVFLVMGGVILGLATERSNLHRRIALLTIRAVGTRPDQIVFGLMLASAFISAWVSNTATAVIMVPIGVSILQLVRNIDPKAVDAKFSASMMLGIAYGVTIGSMATLIGQPPMALMAAYLDAELNYEMQFGKWMMVGVPVAAFMLVVAWLVLTKLVFRTGLKQIPGGKDLIRAELAKLGTMSTSERRVGLIFLVAIFCWVVLPFIAKIPAIAQSMPFLGEISDTQVAMGAAIACFLVPAGKSQGTLLKWESARDIPWGLLLLFGGGLSLSAMFTSTGLSKWIGDQVGQLGDFPPILLLLVAALVGLGLTELTSNTATAAAFFPIMGAVAVGVGVDPLLMIIVMTLAVCSAYMLPVATPSNAVAFGSGEVSIKQMVRAGVWLNVISMVLVVGAIYTLIPWVFNVSL
ncbi:SLC13 family permease [Arthrobacter sp. MYb213]|uniref:SLC13 family permease n=1 Tax=Arthrobacter sp. MYb213 TaxID=1848595 RepID=UPI0015E38522|nr:SLC13 family permease [Arthrobacter sp. MYb213]